MFSFINTSKEVLLVSQTINPEAAGCRIINPVADIEVKPGGIFEYVGYEPGISFQIKPMDNPHIPRSEF